MRYTLLHCNQQAMGDYWNQKSILRAYPSDMSIEERYSPTLKSAPTLLSKVAPILETKDMISPHLTLPSAPPDGIAASCWGEANTDRAMAGFWHPEAKTFFDLLSANIAWLYGVIPSAYTAETLTYKHLIENRLYDIMSIQLTHRSLKVDAMHTALQPLSTKSPPEDCDNGTFSPLSSDDTTGDSDDALSLILAAIRGCVASTASSLSSSVITAAGAESSTANFGGATVPNPAIKTVSYRFLYSLSTEYRHQFFDPIFLKKTSLAIENDHLTNQSIELPYRILPPYDI
uniref:Uncharacterized protein n=1 Tax=Romanomermis culicivorax TaxID=13658 RepID=A0A915IL65_ROMCU